MGFKAVLTLFGSLFVYFDAQIFASAQKNVRFLKYANFRLKPELANQQIRIESPNPGFHSVKI